MPLSAPIAPPKDQRGLASVEFAVSMLVVVTVMLLVAEVGRLLYSYAILTQAVRDGARYASTQSLSPAGAFEFAQGLDGEVDNLVNYGQLTQGGQTLLPGTITVQLTQNTGIPSSGPGRHYVTVDGTYTYTPLFTTTLFGDVDFGMTMQAQNTMRAVN